MKSPTCSTEWGNPLDVPGASPGSFSMPRIGGFGRHPPRGTQRWISGAPSSLNKEITATGAGRTIQCDICHGADLKGLGDVPSIAGRSPMYIARQLWDLKHGARKGTSAALMLATVANLTDEDVLNLAAYLASLEP